nr:putative ribonuclease H-like domain-containing protein [Tanacetum cinerariifolium]
MDFVSSPSSINEVNTAYGVSTANTQVTPASTQVSTTSTQVSTGNLSDATVYAFLASQLNGSHLVHEVLEQIHKDDLEEMDLKWQLALLSMRTRRFFQKTGRKITINGSDTGGYDKIKNQDSRIRNQKSSRRTVNVEDTSSKAMLAIDGAGFDWSYMVDDEVPTYMALMAFLDFESLIIVEISDNSRKGVGFVSYNALPPPHTGLFSPLKIDLSYSGLEEFKQPEFKSYGPKSCEIESKNASEDIFNELKESLDSPLVKDRVKRMVSGNSYTRVNYNYTTKKAYPSAQRNMVPRAVLMKAGLRPLNTARPVNSAHSKTKVYSARPMSCFSKSAHSTVKRPYQQRTTLTNKFFSQKVNTAKGNFYTTRPRTVNTARTNSAVVNAVRTNQVHAIKASASTKDETTGILKKLITEIENLVDKKVKNKVLVVKPYNKTPYELFRGRTPALSFMRSFGCHVTILNTLDHLGKFNEKCDEEFFIGYSLSSRAFRVYNIRTRKVEENLHIRFLEDKPIIADTNSNDFVSTEESLGAGHASKEAGSSKYYILMPLWKDGVSKESRIDDQEKHENSTQDANTAGPSINTVSTNVNTGSLNINTVSLTVTTAQLETTHADFFGDETEVDMSNITTTYLVPSNLNTIIHKDHPLDHMIGRTQEGDPSSKRSKRDKSYARRASDVKSAFLYGKIKEVVYVCQPSRFEDLEFPDKVYKIEKALYGLHQAPRACYETLSTYLLENGFHRGQINKTLFIKRFKGDILLVQVYVDDIIFGSTKKEMCTEFEKIMHKRFQINSIGELTFFLGLQVTQKNDGIFISQDKYVDKILKKFGFSTMKKASTHMETSKPLLKDIEAEDVNVQLYRSMIGSVMYLTASRSDIMFVVFACVRFQVAPKVSHLQDVKRIFRYLKDQPKLGLWYLKDSPFELKAYTDSDYAGASLNRKSTTEGCQYLGSRFISWQCKNMVKHLDGGVKFLMYPRFVQVFLDNKVEGMTKHNEIFLIPSHTKKVFANMKREGKYFSRKVTPLFSTMMVQALKAVGEEKALNKESVPTHSNDPLLSGKDRQKLNELMDLCTNLQNRVPDLENTKKAQALEINSLKRRFKKLEKKKRSRSYGLKRLYKVGLSARMESSGEDEGLGDQEDASKQERKIVDLDADEEISLIDETIEDQGFDNEMFDVVKDIQGEEVIIEGSTAQVSAALTITTDELTLAQALVVIKTSKPKAKSIVMQEPKLEEEERTVNQREEEANMISWDNTQAMIEVDYELAQRLQTEEHEELSIEERSKLFVELMDKRKKHFARLRAKEQRRQPPTKAQMRNTMSTYLRNMAGYKHTQLKKKSFEDILGRVAARSSTKRAGGELQQESTKKQKVENDDDSIELKRCLEIVYDDGDDVTVEATPLSSKSPTIVDYKIYKEGRMREDLEVLWSIVKARF